MTATIDGPLSLTLDAEGENYQDVPVAEPHLFADGDGGLLTIDDLLDLTPDQLVWRSRGMSDQQKFAVVALLQDPAVIEYARLRVYRHDPNGFVRGVLGEYFWSAQRAIAESVRDHRQTVVPACHGPGKSHSAARIIAWWLSTHAPGDAFALTTAPTGDQVRSILWKEINRAHSAGHLPGRTNLSQWYIGGELVALGRKPSDTNPAALQGHHARFFLVVIDEADGVHANIFDAVQTLTTTAHCRILAIGNPDTNSGRFYDACLPGSGWNVIRISAFDTPNFNGHPERTVPDEHGVPVAVLENLVDESYVDSIANDKHFGIESARYRSKVLAIAPEDMPNAVMPLSKLRDCMLYPDRTDRQVQWDPETLELTVGMDLGPVEVGIDVGAGGDFTVCRERRGPVLGRVLRLRDADTMKQIPRIVAFLNLVGADVAKVDIVGVGQGVGDRLTELHRERVLRCRIVRVNVGRAGRKPNARRTGFPKLRDQIWWEVGRANTFDLAWDLSVLHDEQHVLPELFQPTYEEMTNGMIHVQTKDEQKAALGHSPDDADAILLCYAKVQSPGRTSIDQLLG